MKITHLTLLTALIGSSAYGIERTSVIAAKMHYPQLIIRLRNQTDTFLAHVRIQMRIDVQNLRSKNLELRADEMAILSKDAYFELEKKIDATFEELSRIFITGAQKLDYDDAPLKAKQAFVSTMKKLAQEKVTKLLVKKANHAHNNPLNVDI